MSDFPASKPTRLLLGVIIATLTATACVEPVEQTGSPATVDTIGAARLIQPREASAPYEQVAIPYVLCDMDLDDVDIDVEVCEDGSDTCGSPVQGFGSDGTVAIPTRPCDLGGSSHLFVWDVCVGIMNASTKTLSRPSPDTSYTVTIRQGASAETTAPFDLASLGLGDLASNCASGIGE